MRIVVDQHLPFVYKAFGPLGEVRAVDTAELTAAAVREADAVIVRSPTSIGRALLEGSRVQFVGTATIGTDHVDLDYLASRGIAFASAPGSNSNSVKEYVVGALLRLAAMKHVRLRGLTVGIVGVGHVGSKVRRALEALGMRTLLNDPPLARSTSDPRFVSLDALMDADVITLHVPLTKAGTDPTFHLFDAARFGRLKQGSIFLNTSRGAVVDTPALKKALRSGRIGMSVVDVWENEPNIDAEVLEHVTIGTPHIAGYSTEGKATAVGMVRTALCAHFGIDSPWDPLTEFAPLPRREIAVRDEEMSLETLLCEIVSRSYDILEDDRMLRELIALNPGERGAYFKRLRTGYRERREFSNAIVSLPQRHAGIAHTLQALGFSCRQDSGDDVRKMATEKHTN